MRLTARSGTAMAAVLGMLITSAAYAQSTPAFDYQAPPPATKAPREWKAAMQAGLILNNGNAENISFSAAASGSVFDGKNKGSLDVGGAYAQSTVLASNDRDADGLVSSDDEVVRKRSTTAAMWNVKLRYDRFITPNNTFYAAALASGNEPAGKRLVSGGQVGYQRQLFKSDLHLVRLEGGYDFSFERSTQHFATPSVPDLFVHSIRLFVGYDMTFNKDSVLKTYCEVLMNVNREDGPRAGTHISPFQDTRVNFGVALITKLWQRLNFRFGLSGKFDNAPNARPKLDLPYAPNYVPLAEKLDTVVDASLVFTFL